MNGKRSIDLAKGIKKKILGENSPPKHLRYICWIGLLFALYIFVWNLFKFFVLFLIDKIEGAGPVIESFDKFKQEYGFETTEDLIRAYSYNFLTIGLSSLIVFTGLIFLWRKQKLGVLFYFLGNAVAAASPIIIVGFEFFKQEAWFFNYTIPITITILSLLYFRKTPDNRKKNILQYSDS